MRKAYQLLLVSLATAALTLSAASCGNAGTTAPAVTTPPATTGAPGNQPGGNQSPVLKSLVVKPEAVKPDEIAEFRCDATDADGDVLTYSWTTDGGIFTSEAVSKQYWINWRAPKFPGNFTISVNITDGKGGSTTKTYLMSVANNRAPVISSIVINPPTPKPNDPCTITATVADPDGDTFTYTWLSSTIKVAGSGNTGTFVAPATDGIYEIELKASDGKDGGTSTQTVKVTVQTPSNSVTLTQVTAESGTVAKSSDFTTAYYRAGDDENNNALQAFFSFDLSNYKSATVTAATLTFTVKGNNGSPFSITPPFVYVEPVYYGARALKGADYDMAAQGAVIAKLDAKTPTEYNVSGPVADAVSTGRYQIRVRLGGTTNSNKVADNVELTGATLKITFQK